MSSVWSKEKENFYIIGENTGRKYHIDINTLVLYGCSGKALKNIPTEIKRLKHSNSALPTIIEDYLRAESWRKSAYLNIYKKAVILADKIYSLDNKVECDSIFDIARNILENKIKEKDFINYVRMEIEKENFYIYRNDYFTYRNFNAIKNRLKSYDLTEMEIKDYLKAYDIMTDDHYSDKEIDRAFYYLYNGVYECYKPIEDYFNVRYCLSNIKEYFDICKKMEIEPKKGDFFKIYIEAKKNYRVYKADYDKKALIKNQSKELFFENDDYCVVIPTTSEEFKEEAFQQNNCVFRCYLKSVVNGITNIVFIRDKKDINHSLVTCEVRNGVIRQYLIKNNRCPCSEALINFKNEYQNYLNSLE